MSIKMRTECDSIGKMEVPEDAYYGVQALRAKCNFPITGHKVNPAFIKSLALVKKAAAITNRELSSLNKLQAESISRACDEVIQGRFQEEFIVDAIQGGAGTSTNMNMNEVLANRANELLGFPKGTYYPIHPNDHVNMSQSTNDVIPTAGKLAVLSLLVPLVKELERLSLELSAKSAEFWDIMKIGRTQLQDAVPMRLGQSFRAYASMVRRDCERIRKVSEEMHAVNLGGTAIGTCINAESGYVCQAVANLSRLSGLPFQAADDLFDATQNLDGFVMVSGALKTCAVNLSKMSNDLRLLSSGPRTGFHEISLPARQNGSSIMPGKVNPVIPEVVSQVAFLVIGHDMTVTMAAEAGQLELNAFEPVLFYHLFESITALKEAVSTLRKNCISGITANEGRCHELLDSSVGTVTALCPYIGYQKAADIAKKALSTGKTVKELVLAERLMDAKYLSQVLAAEAMTEPGKHLMPAACRESGRR